MNLLKETFITVSKSCFLESIKNVNKEYKSGLREYIKNMKDIDVLANMFNLDEITDKKTLFEIDGKLQENRNLFEDMGLYYILEDIVYQEVNNMLCETAMSFNQVYQDVMAGLKTIYKGDIPEGAQKKVAELIKKSKSEGHTTEKATSKILGKFKTYSTTSGHRFFDRVKTSYRFNPGAGAGAGRDYGYRTYQGFRPGSESYKAYEEAFKRYEEAIRNYNKSMKRIRATRLVLGTIYVFLIVSSLTYIIYTTYFSKSHQFCAKYEMAPARHKKCMKDFKNKAKLERIRFLQDSKKVCSKTKNPKKCVKKINDKIDEIKQSLK